MNENAGATAGVMKFSPLERRILTILYNSKGFMNSSKISQILSGLYREGQIDHKYGLNYVSINLRELHSLGLIDRKPGGKPYFGKTSLYVINDYGKEQFILSQKSKL